MIPTPKFFFQNSSMNSITHNQKRKKWKKMQKEVKRPNQISIKFNTTQIERSTL
jgi:hypothetical protein